MPKQDSRQAPWSRSPVPAHFRDIRHRPFQGVAGSSAAELRLRLEVDGLGEPSIAMPTTATRSYPTPPLRHLHRSSVQSKTSTSSPPSKPSRCNLSTSWTLARRPQAEPL